MKMRRINCAIWTGCLLSLIAFLSYFFVFIWFPVTRDFPWASLLLLGIAAALLLLGCRRAFAPDRPHPIHSTLHFSRRFALPSPERSASHTDPARTPERSSPG